MASGGAWSSSCGRTCRSREVEGMKIVRNITDVLHLPAHIVHVRTTPKYVVERASILFQPLRSRQPDHRVLRLHAANGQCQPDGDAALLLAARVRRFHPSSFAVQGARRWERALVHAETAGTNRVELGAGSLPGKRLGAAAAFVASRGAIAASRRAAGLLELISSC